MSASGRDAAVQALELDARTLRQLESAAELFDEFTTSTPAPDGPYSAADFVEWLRLEMRGRGYHHRGDQHENRAAGQQRRQQTRSLAVAS